MSLVALKIFALAIAKTLLEAFHIDAKLLNALLEETIDVSIDGVLSSQESQKSVAKKIDQIAKQLATDIKPLFLHEAKNLEAGSQNAILIGVAETLIKARLTSDALAEINFDEERLKQHLLKVNQEAVRFFSRSELALYEQVVVLASKRLIEAAPQVEGFVLSTATTTLKRLEDISHHLKIERELSLLAADEFVGQYRCIVKDELDKLEVFGLPKMDRLTSRQSLSMAYINLSASSANDEHDDEKAPLILMDDERLERGLRNRSRSIDDAMHNCRRLVIRGGAGAGKSTLLQWIAVCAASQNFPEKLQHWNGKIPFFIRLRRLVDGNFPTPEDFPKLIAPNFAATMPKDWVHRYLKRGQALVLIDGVDELPRLQREEFFESLKDLVRDFDKATYIVTSRPSGLKNLQGEEWIEWEDWVKDSGFVNWTLEPMSKENIEKFVTRWHCALSESQSDDLTQIGKNLNAQLRQRAELRRLASTPLLCAMICALYQERKENLPSARLELYQNCIDMLLNRRDSGRKIPIDDTYPIGLNESQKIELLQSFALKLMRLNLSTLEAERVDRHFKDELGKTSLPKEITGRQIRDLFVDRSGLLREPSVNYIDFAHRTFQEYLAAKAALDDDSLEELLARATDDQWRESIIVAAGLARAKERVILLENLIEHGNRDLDKKQYLHLLAVACLETATSVEPTTREKVSTCAKALLPPKNDDEVPMFAAVGNEIIPLLKYESHYSAEEASRCIATLVQIGNRDAMLTIVDYAKAKFEPEHGQEYGQFLISREIGEGWDIFDQSTYISQVLSQLTKLSLNSTQVTDLSALSVLNQLTELSLSNMQVTDLSALSVLNQLRELSLFNMQVTDLSALSGLNQLTGLFLFNMQVADLSALSVLNQLRELYLMDTQVTELSALSGLNQLSRLNLSHTQVTELSALSGLNQLSRLNLSHTQVTDLSALSGLNQLTELNLSYTQVTDLSALSGLNQLIELYLNNTQVTDLSALSGLDQLTELDLSNTQVTDLSALSGLNQLTELDLRNTQVTNLSALSGLNQLKRLILSNTQVTDLSTLKNLSKLTIATDSQEKLELWKSQGLKVNLISRN